MPTNWTPEQLASFLDKLVALKEKGPTSPTDGICYNVDPQTFIFTDYDAMVREYAKGWPKHSGNMYYPVPCTKNSATCNEYYAPRIEYYECNRLWDRRLKYGRMRWELVDYLIETVKQDLKGGTE